MPKQEDSVQRCFKYPFSSCEILSSEIKDINEIMFKLPPAPEINLQAKMANDDEVIHDESNSKEHIELSPEKLEIAEDPLPSHESKKEIEVQAASLTQQEISG